MGTSGGASGTTSGNPGISSDLMYFPVQGVTTSRLKKVGKLKIELNEEGITLLYTQGKVFAIQEKCPHQGGPLYEGRIGEIEDLPIKSPCISCPWHNWKFNIVTGECVFPKSRPDKKLKTYAVQVNNEEIRIGFQRIAPAYFTDPPK